MLILLYSANSEDLAKTVRVRVRIPPPTHRLHLGWVVPHVDVGVLQGLVH